MSAIIVSAAYFKLCPCRTHGHIIFSDKSKSADVYSIKDGVSEVEKAKRKDVISEFEIQELLRSISIFGLPNEEELDAEREVCVEFLVEENS